MTARAAIAIDGVDDLDRLRRAVAQARAVGGDLGWLAEKLAERIEAIPAPRITRRDAALVDLASNYVGSNRKRAREMEADLRRYAASRWRFERSLTAAPATHGGKAQALFAVMMASPRGGAPGFETIRRAVDASGAWVKNRPVAITHGGRESSPDQQKRRLLQTTFKPDQIEALAAIVRSPDVKKAVAADKARIVAERQAHIEKIKALDAEAAVSWPKRQRVISDAAKKVRESEIALREANDALAAARAADINASMAYTRSRQAEEQALLAGADVQTITAFRSKLLDETTLLQRNGAIVTAYLTERNKVTGRAGKGTASNAASVAKRLAAVCDAIQRLGELQLEADQSKLPDRIAEIWQSLPAVSQDPIFKNEAA